MKEEWIVSAGRWGMALCLGTSLFLSGCGSTPPRPGPSGSPPPSGAPAPSSPSSKGGPPPVSGSPVPVPSARGGAAPAQKAGKSHGTVKSFAPDRTTVTIVINSEDVNFKVNPPTALANVNPGDEIDFVTEGVPDKGFILISSTVTKASGNTPAPVAPGAPVAAPPSGAPAPPAASGAPAPAAPASPKAK